MISEAQAQWLHENSGKKDMSMFVKTDTTPRQIARVTMADILGDSNAGPASTGMTPIGQNPAPEGLDVFAWRARQILARAGHNSLLDLEQANPQSLVETALGLSPGMLDHEASSTETAEGSDIGYCRNVVLRY